MHNPTEEPKEGDIRTYVNDNNREVREVYKCRHKVPGMEISILCSKNQHQCIELNGKSSLPCDRKELVWMRKL